MPAFQIAGESLGYLFSFSHFSNAFSHSFSPFLARIPLMKFNTPSKKNIPEIIKSLESKSRRGINNAYAPNHIDNATPTMVLINNVLLFSSMSKAKLANRKYPMPKSIKNAVIAINNVVSINPSFFSLFSKLMICRYRLFVASVMAYP